ncbi:MAG: hypothetical protein ACPMAQ_12780 [Phycisphaerae bacterium]
MSTLDVDELLRCFHRRMAYCAATRWLVVLSIAAAFAIPGPPDGSGASAFAAIWLVAVLLGWLLLVIVSVRTARTAHLASALLSLGRLDEAEEALADVLKSFSIFRSTLLRASQQLGTLLHARQEHGQAVKVFQAILRSVRSGLRRQRSLEAAIRLMWADCELAVGNLTGAYEAFRPVYTMQLGLSERLLLLPVELRYDLAAGHARHAAGNLAEKIRLAELLESPQAASVHAMLAEACRGAGMPAQAEFLERRACLYRTAESPAPTT